MNTNVPNLINTFDTIASRRVISCLSWQHELAAWETLAESKSLPLRREELGRGSAEGQSLSGEVER